MLLECTRQIASGEVQLSRYRGGRFRGLLDAHGSDFDGLWEVSRITDAAVMWNAARGGRPRRFPWGSHLPCSPITCYYCRSEPLGLRRGHTTIQMIARCRHLGPEPYVPPAGRYRRQGAVSRLRLPDAHDYQLLGSQRAKQLRSSTTLGVSGSVRHCRLDSGCTNYRAGPGFMSPSTGCRGANSPFQDRAVLAGAANYLRPSGTAPYHSQTH